MDSIGIYRKKMREFDDRINAFVDSKPEIRSLIGLKAKDFENSFLPADQTGMLLFDWITFDYRDKSGLTVLDKFLENGGFDWEDKATYAGFKDNKFGIFHVKAVKTGKEAVLAMLPQGKEYHVYDTTMTKEVKKGDVIVTRFIAFRDIYILSGPVLTYPETMADTMKVIFEGKEKTAADFQYTPLDLIDMFEKRGTKKEKKTDIYEAAKETGIKKDKVDALMEKIHLAAKDRSVDPMALFNEFMDNAGNFHNETIEKLAAAYFDRWNAIAADKGAEKGPLETALIAEAMKEAIIKDVKPLEIEDPVERQRKVDEYKEKWLVTPLATLEGRTPKKAILKERESRGDSQKEVAYSMFFDMPNPKKAEQKAEKLYNEALELMKTEKYDEAISKYLKYIKLYSGNHIVWYNMSMCYIKQGIESSSLTCIKNSLDIKPDYDFAAKGLNNLINYGSSEIRAKAKRMAKKYGITIHKLGIVPGL
jgi:tetratricopeptide (TPR) repeat protein